MNVPFLDLTSHHAPLLGEIQNAIHAVITAGAFAGGPFVDEFESAFAGYCQCDHGVGLGSGTEALWLALLAAGIGAGDEVITVPSTFIATAEAIVMSGAKPVFVDVDEETHTMDPAALEAAITWRTKAVIPVHLFGQTADMDPIMEIARRHSLFVVEDACQAHGAEYKGRRAGSLGDAGCFSFYPGKNLGAMGDAGALVTNDEGLARKIRILRDHGQTKKYHHSMFGWNCRMDGIQAAVLSVKLRHLEKATHRRRGVASVYQQLLQDVEEIVLPHEAPYSRHVYHVYAIQLQERDEMKQALERAGIGCGIHYPVPVHLQEALGHLGYREGDFPVAEKAASRFLSLPMYPELTASQMEQVVARVKGALCAVAC